MKKKTKATASEIDALKSQNFILNVLNGKKDTLIVKLKRENEKQSKILKMLKKYFSITYEDSDVREGESIYCSIPYVGLSKEDYAEVKKWLENAKD